MPTLTIRGVPQQLHERLKGRAKRNHRSLNSETLFLLEQALETLPEDAEVRRRYRALRANTPPGSPSALGPGRSSDDTPVRSESIVREGPTDELVLDSEAVLCLLRDQRDRLRALGVRRIGLFGSVLRGESRCDSDVDLLVEFEPARKTFNGLLRLASFLEDVLQRDVDLTTTEGLSPYIGPKILREAEFVRISR